MKPRLLLDVGKRLLTRSKEEDWRTAANRAYYTLFLECRDALTRWGFVAPKSDNVHRFVQQRFYLTSNPDLTMIGKYLGDSSKLRTRADYETTSTSFLTDSMARISVTQADDALKLLDSIDADPSKRAAAIFEIRSRWP